MIKITKLDELKNANNAGTQDKWKINNTWYKTDDFNYEGLAETICSDMLKKSNVKRFAIYEPELIQYRGKLLTGCRSENFLNKGEKLVEIHELFNKHNAEPDPYHITDFVDKVKIFTGLSNFDNYITKMLELDKITLNSDRHYSNIAVIKNKSQYDYAPFFDQGRCFALSDSYWKYDNNPERIVEMVEPRLHYENFDKQAKEMEQIYGKLLIIKYGKEDLDDTLNKCASVYDDKILKRAEIMVSYQMDLNKEYFINNETKILLEELKQKFQDSHIGYDVFIDDTNVVIKNEYATFIVRPDEQIITIKDGKEYDSQAIFDNHIILTDSKLFHLYRQVYYAIHEEQNIDTMER